MRLRTSVTGCIAMLGVVSVTTGCAGRVPGQASAIELRAMAPLAKQLATAGAPKAVTALATLATATDPKLMALPVAKAGDQPADPASAKPDGVKVTEAVAAPATVTPAVTPVVAAAEPAPKADTAPAPEAVAALPVESPVTPVKADVEPVTPAAPEVGFMIPSLADLAAALEPAAEANVLFRDSFEDGLAAWVSRGLGSPAAASPAGDTVVLATSRARRSMWIKTRTEIDLGQSDQPRLRLDFKGEPVALKAVWETEHGAFTEEVLLAPLEAEDAAEDAPLEFDLTALKHRPGHLVLVARAPKGGGAAPVLDGVTIFDAKGPAPELDDTIASR